MNRGALSNYPRNPTTFALPTVAGDIVSLESGERFLGSAPEMFQLGGDFVIDKSGTMAFAHRMKNNGDRASTATLLDELVLAGGT